MAIHALYPGTFDVFTYGHLDIIRRASRLFEQVTVAIAENPSKMRPLFTTEERVEMIRQSCREYPNVGAATFPGLTVEYAKSINATVILRGLRAVSDFEFEFQLAMMNENLAPEITTLFMAPSPHLSFVSSSLVKEIARYGGEISSFVPPEVEAILLKKQNHP